MEQDVIESRLKGQLESATQQAEQYKVISFVLLNAFLPPILIFVFLYFR